MKVSIKRMPGDIPIKINGISLEIKSPDGNTHLGKLRITKTVLEWCNGAVAIGDGKKVKWEDFIEWIKEVD